MIIYKSENKINGKVYIGKTVCKLQKRKNEHKNQSLNANYNSAFHNAIRKYGWDNFKWEILAETDSESKLNALEKFYIAAYRKMGVCYNMTDGGEGATGRVLSFESIEKIRNSSKKLKHSAETKQFLSELSKNRIFTEEHRKKISESKKGKTLPEEHRKNISLSKMGEKNPWFNKKRPEFSEKMKGHANWCNPDKILRGENHPRYGKKHSEETRLKMSESAKRRGKNEHL